MVVQKQPKADEGVSLKWQTLRDLSALPIIQVLRIGGIVDLKSGGHYHSRSSAGIIRGIRPADASEDILYRRIHCPGCGGQF